MIEYTFENKAEHEKHTKIFNLLGKDLFIDNQPFRIQKIVYKDDKYIVNYGVQGQHTTEFQTLPFMGILTKDGKNYRIGG